MATYQELQSKNVRKSWLMVFVMFVLFVAAGSLIGLLFGGAQDGYRFAVIGAIVAGAVAGLQALVAFSAGADIVLRVHGAQEIEGDTPGYQQLYNVVEEMKIASGLPMPRVYVMQDSSPNAFATGRGPNDGRVCVTTGLMERLDREELQGVIAHEMAHIKNKDVLFMTIVGIMAGTIVILSDVALRSIFWSGGRVGGGRDDKGGQAIIIVVALLFAILAPIFAQLVRMAISRQREYLADATGAQFTRYPAGLASALQKIANAGEPLRSRNRGTEHMFISPPSAKFTAAFSTHPPLQDRIARLQELGRSFGQ